MKKDEVSGFAGLAVEYWRANKDKTLPELGTYLFDKLNVQLAANGVPRLPAPTFGTTKRRAGGFSHTTWTVDVDVGQIAGHPAATKIGELTSDEVAKVAGTCYHEARHSEQAFLVARLVATQAKGKKDAKAIATELDIPVPIAEAALNSSAAPPDKAAMAKIEQWHALGQSGKHQDYWDWNETFRGFVVNVYGSLPSPRPTGVERIREAWTALTPTIASWRKDSMPFVDAKIAKLTAAKTRDAADNRVLGDLKKIRNDLHKLTKADKALSDEVAKFQTRKEAAAKKTKPPLTVPEARSIQLQFESLWLNLDEAVVRLRVTTEEAYRAYPNEADAYEAQEAVVKAFSSKSKSSSTKP